MPYATPPDNTGRADPQSIICSAQRCREPAAWAVVWNNPRIHLPDREKIWTACPEHRDHLAEYLRRHGMNLLRIDPIATVVESGSTAGPRMTD